MDDIRTVVKELHRIAKALEKQNRNINFSPDITVTVGETQENAET